MRRQWSITSLRWPGEDREELPVPVLDQRVDRRHNRAGSGRWADPTVTTGRNLMLDQQPPGRDEQVGDQPTDESKSSPGHPSALLSGTPRAGAGARFQGPHRPTLMSRHQRLTSVPRHPHPLTSPRERGQLRRYRPRGLAATLPQNSPAHEVLLNLARVTQHRSTTSALGELRTLAECEQRSIDYGRHNGDVTVVAAHPLPIPEVAREAVSEQDRRGGWLEVLTRTDRLAAECVRQVKMWDGGRDFPFSNPEQINPNTEYGAEWAARLEPIEHTVAFELIDPDGSRETLTDPETGAIVGREPDGLLLATIPQQLPTFGPLAEIIFDCAIWVRTEDGRLYPAPRTVTGD